MAGFLKAGCLVEVRKVGRTEKVQGLEPGKQYELYRLMDDIATILVDAPRGFSLGNGKRGVLINKDNLRRV